MEWVVPRLILMSIRAWNASALVLCGGFLLILRISSPRLMPLQRKDKHKYCVRLRGVIDLYRGGGRKKRWYMIQSQCQTYPSTGIFSNGITSLHYCYELSLEQQTQWTFPQLWVLSLLTILIFTRTTHRKWLEKQLPYYFLNAEHTYFW